MHHTISVLRAREVEKSCLHAFRAAQPDEDVFKYQMPWISIKDLKRWHLNSLYNQIARLIPEKRWHVPE